MLNFDFLGKSLRTVPPRILCMNFKEKYFILYSIDWPNLIDLLPLLLEILGNMCIVIVC